MLQHLLSQSQTVHQDLSEQVITAHHYPFGNAGKQRLKKK